MYNYNLYTYYSHWHCNFRVLSADGNQKSIVCHAEADYLMIGAVVEGTYL